ncbi:putative signaling protein [Methylobacterium tardum]|jgi:diguanylate cyclase|uniref:Bifunctional diguanylate cyclase/phosphodiesterase n=1 Tax=Methylobacterium tardum TaxID=374432 RepID=A0AA37WQ03_9HYPH|nr:EAL domain-containing protein [Methylobacterium tardum]URD36322.1 EAL domain-containing protein [Methylobacterium tardum]GJE47766.1 putative signaling protein [Methylobacterium tardum]GLS69595.1 bifunctional diguanylate cyclase/phosphodiesterase [Methylobacterium tardum]
MRSVYTCLAEAHDHRLILLAAAICITGVYGSFSVAAHAARSMGRAAWTWGAAAIVASGCTAWATHMVALLAFRPGMPAGFEPTLTALSLLIAIGGIGISIGFVIGQRDRARRFAAGLALGISIAALHYLGEASYLVAGTVVWDPALVAVSLAASLLMFGAALMVAGERRRPWRRAAAPLLLAGIGVLHLGGMAAMTLTFDPERPLPAEAVPPEVVAPIVACVSFGLLTLALVGLRLTLSARAQARRDQERLRELANLAVEGLAVCDGETIKTANRSLEQMSGVGAGALSGRRLSDVLPGLVVSALPEREEREAELVGADGQSVPVRVLRSEVPLGSGLQTVLAVRDQRERLQTESRMRMLAYSDALTGLPNRAHFHDLLARHAASCGERDQPFAVFILDLDRFKLVNDTLGHGLGDTLLRKAAERLTAALGAQDLVARLGGDEFAVLQAAPDGPEAVQALAARIIELIDRPFLIDGQLVNVGASVGAALAPADGREPGTLLRNADLALYKAKADGKGTFRRFDPMLDARVQARRSLEADLRRAITVQEFELHYQPLVDARTGRITAAEALVRWRHPERGLVPPADFIPLAEETGLIGPLGQWVLRTACTQAARWPSHIRVAVNLSPAQFRDLRLAETVKAALTASGLAADRLELEITEGVLLADEERTLATLTRLRAAGVSISMDDFGTGYSSLSYLRRFPFDKIKVDRSFVRQLPGDPESAAIVRAIITMGACLGMTITVEGVETAEQFAFTAASGCDQVQGYHVSRPLPEAEFLSFVDAREAA